MCYTNRHLLTYLLTACVAEHVTCKVHYTYGKDQMRQSSHGILAVRERVITLQADCVYWLFTTDFSLIDNVMHL